MQGLSLLLAASRIAKPQPPQEDHSDQEEQNATCSFQWLSGTKNHESEARTGDHDQRHGDAVDSHLVPCAGSGDVYG